MSDIRYSGADTDCELISLSEDYEIYDWSKKFGVSRTALRNAVKIAGNNAKRIAKVLKNKMPANKVR